MSELAIDLQLDGIRKAYMGDIPSMVRLGFDALHQATPSHQRISWKRLNQMAEQCVFSDENFAEVVIKDGHVQGALCALVHDQLVFERKQASIVQWYCVVPGEGRKLFRRFLDWASQPKIKCIAFMPEVSIEPRIGKLMMRYGFNLEEAWVQWR